MPLPCPLIFFPTLIWSAWVSTQANSAVSGDKKPKQKESRTAGVAEETDKEQMRSIQRTSLKLY